MSEIWKLFSPFKKLFKVDVNEANTDNNVFRLHYRASAVVLLACATLVGAKEYIGAPVQCLSMNKEISAEVLNAYCWIFSTYTYPEQNMLRVGKDVAQPGVGSHRYEGEEVRHHRYYQWVCFALFLQSVLFRIPHTLWRMWEKGLMSSLIKDLNQPLISQACKKERMELLVDYLNHSRGHQNKYFWRFVLCELLNLVNVIGQIYFMDMFLDGEFISYGTEVMDCAGRYSDRCTNPMSRIFPKLGKCEFFKYGASGSLETRDAWCVLSLNIINEKLYIFLWFWFMSLSALTGSLVIYRICVVVSPKLRLYLLYSRSERASFKLVRYICSKGYIGDWFVLYQISKNIDTRVFVELLVELQKNLSASKVQSKYVLPRNNDICVNDPIKEQTQETILHAQETVAQVHPQEIIQLCYA